MADEGFPVCVAAFADYWRAQTPEAQRLAYAKLMALGVKPASVEGYYSLEARIASLEERVIALERLTPNP